MPRLTPERIAELRDKLKDGRFGLIDADEIIALLDDLAEQTERAEEAELAISEFEQAAINAGDEAFELRTMLKDIYDLDSEERAIGGGPGFSERKSAVMRRVAEEFEP